MKPIIAPILNLPRAICQQMADSQATTTAKEMRAAVNLLINNMFMLDAEQLAALAITVETEHVNREAEMYENQW